MRGVIDDSAPCVHSRCLSQRPTFLECAQLWKKIKQQETHLQYFETFEALTAKVEQALVKFANAREEILSLFGLEAKAA